MLSKVKSNSYMIDAIKLFQYKGVFNKIWGSKIDGAIIKVLHADLLWYAHNSVVKSALPQRQRNTLQNLFSLVSRGSSPLGSMKKIVFTVW